MDRKLSRQEASEATGAHGWRFLLGTLRTSVPVHSLHQAAVAAMRAAEVCGSDADGHLRSDIRADRVVLTLQTRAIAALTALDADLARRLFEAMIELNLRPTPESVQQFEIAIDALDIASIRPFWKAVLGYLDEPGATGPEDPIVDPLAQAPPVWFQQMDVPRPQRNRMHLDVAVPHDEAPGRIAAALAAGGRLVSADRAPAFWVLADAEGNEVCVTTWQGRD
ncbi:VOC family protein [Actinoplanes aureus]|uniref:4a-hydroxytetrahydrobiopterin dehydratase n=1 Tax=Actinoplanes aureus TaxID=2792083 RepID=A0A931FVU7_9ACTN|nr:VOC family protein [Actinoplanes aureus]MBG0560625.1 4a-hydroxytetrahydrobiopterin dehydratase [Actinoplanes aureus]